MTGRNERPTRAVVALLVFVLTLALGAGGPAQERTST